MPISDFVKSAIKLNGIQARYIDETKGYSSRAIYNVDGEQGLWRRVSRKGKSTLEANDGNVLCFCDDEKRLIELALDAAIVTELQSILPGQLPAKPF